MIVSDPPHGQVNAEHAAPCVGLTPAEVRMKTEYTIPEIWVADRSRIRIEATAQTLRLSGQQLAVVPSRALLLPPQRKVGAFRFGDTCLVVDLCDGSYAHIPYDTPTVAVLCQPLLSAVDTDETRGNGRLARVFASPRLAGNPCDEDATGDGSAEFLDLYVSTNTGLIRLAFLGKSLDAAESDPNESDTSDHLSQLAQECEQRMSALRVDRRLVDMQPRLWPMAGKPTDYFTPRKGYSYGSERLGCLLGSVAPGLSELGHVELASRLAYLTVSNGRATSIS